jgi:hypothetical protein
MESALYRNQQNLQSNMSKLKAQYEHRLGLQQKEIDGITTSIGDLSAKIQRTKMSNAMLRKHAADVQHNNSLLRIQVKSLESKIQTAKAFVAQTLDSTDVASSEDLAVLNTPEPISRPKPHPDALLAPDTVEKAIDYIVYGRHGDQEHVSGSSADQNDVAFDDVAEAPAFLQVSASAGAKGKVSYPQTWRYKLDARNAASKSAGATRKVSSSETWRHKLNATHSRDASKVASESAGAKGTYKLNASHSHDVRKVASESAFAKGKDKLIATHSRDTSKVASESAGTQGKNKLNATRSRNASKVASEFAKKGQRPYLAAIQTNPMSFLVGLRSAVDQLEVENRNSMDNLSARFEDRYKDGLERRSFLMARKEKKEAKLKSVESLNTKLRVADAALDRTHEELQKRIKGLKLFLSTLSSGVRK